MTIGEIKIEALKLMSVNYAFDINTYDLTRLASDENYGSYIVNMHGSIARALDRIENACVLPQKKKTLLKNEMVIGKHFLRFDTNKIGDCFLVDRVTAEYDDGTYSGNADFMMEGSDILLKNRLATYTIIYYPQAPTLVGRLDTDELPMPDNLSRIIPYFIKGELYQEEEPALAADARNLFEAMLDDMQEQMQNTQTRIERVLKMY